MANDSPYGAFRVWFESLSFRMMKKLVQNAVSFPGQIILGKPLYSLFEYELTSKYLDVTNNFSVGG
ncbi:MAG: hypothetical protein ACLU4J_27595 [Butyricimonas paravirosa]